jgi:DNA-binding transcriptional ArsR family regulator
MNDFPTGNLIAQSASLMGDPARASMLAALIGGQALTAGELAANAGITPQTASGHLAKLLEGRLITLEQQGRHRYFRLTSPVVAQALEGLMALSGLTTPLRVKRSAPRDAKMRWARTCYDHMAGQLAVAVADNLEHRGLLHQTDGAGVLSDEGRRFFCDFGIDLSGTKHSKRLLCRMCLDWSERRPHLAGRLGSALLARTIELGWISRIPNSRTLRISSAGNHGFAEMLALPTTNPSVSLFDHLNSDREVIQA